MHNSSRQEFVDFARERTPELFPVAYALAGRQDAAEKLLQTALEKTLLRWRRLDDPYAFAVRAMRRGSLPWWQRWRRLDGAPPAPGSGGRVVDVSDLALSGARRRRLASAGLASGGLAVVLALALAVPSGLVRWSSPADGPDGPPSPHLAGQVVVASMNDGQGNAQTLDPHTGGYVTGGGVVSPDLRHSIDPGGSAETMRLMSTTDGGGLGELIELPGSYRGFLWAPDSSRLAAGELTLDIDADTFDAAIDSLTNQFRELLVFDVARQEAAQVALDLPGGRVGTHLSWLDAGHLAVAVVDEDAVVAVEPTGQVDLPQGGQATIGGGPRAVVDEILLLDLGGDVVDRVPVPQDDFHDTGDADLIWRPGGATGDGRLLLARAPDDDLLEIATVEPADGSLDVAAFTLPEPPDQHVRMPVNPEHALEPLAGDRLLVRVQLVIEADHPDFGSGTASIWRDGYLVADPDDGTVRPAEIPGLHEQARLGTIGEAVWLSADAAHLAFQP